jgi:hypothetical protein
MFFLGSLIAVAAAVVFAAVGLLTLWGGAEAVARELGPDFVRSAATGARRLGTLLMAGLPIAVVGLFALLAAWRILAVALGMG